MRQDLFDWIAQKSEMDISLGIQHVQDFIQIIDARLPPLTKVIHIAGTNGKGSTCAFLESIALKGGIKVGMFTSPKLLFFEEQIRINGKPIERQKMRKKLAFIQKNIEENPEIQPTLFEILFGVALLAFKEDCQLAIIETGLGGRLDATNSIKTHLSLIGKISLDHQNYLGNSILKIAKEKAGIIRKKQVALSVPQEEKVEKVLKEISEKQHSPLHFILPEKIKTSLKGEHQQTNATLAKEAMKHLYPHLSQTQILSGLMEAKWSGRFEKREYQGKEIILDIAHNIDSAQALLNTWKSVYQGQKANLILGFCRDKDWRKILSILSPIGKRIFLSAFNHPRSLSIEELKGEKIPLFSSLEKAMAEMIKYEEPTLISGSTFLVAEAQEILEKENLD